jgi:hypothetical protein
MKSGKKPVVSKSVKRRTSQKVKSDSPSAPLSVNQEPPLANGQHYERPQLKNNETAEAREKRLAKREALTLKAFRLAYDNHHDSRHVS